MTITIDSSAFETSPGYRAAERSGEISITMEEKRGKWDGGANTVGTSRRVCPPTPARHRFNMSTSAGQMSVCDDWARILHAGATRRRECTLPSALSPIAAQDEYGHCARFDGSSVGYVGADVEEIGRRLVVGGDRWDGTFRTSVLDAPPTALEFMGRMGDAVRGWQGLEVHAYEVGLSGQFGRRALSISTAPDIVSIAERFTRLTIDV